MKINVPEWAIGHFWDEPPAGHHEFWAMRFQPKCMIGDMIKFYFKKKLIAQAVVSYMEGPGRSMCESSGRFGGRYKVFWSPESFEDLRSTDADAGFLKA